MRYFALLLGLCLAACATRGGFEKTMNSYIGNSESSLVMGMGPPQNVYQAPGGDGVRLLSWSRSSNMQLGGNTTYQPVTATTNGNIYGNNGGSATYRSTTTSYQPVTQPTYNIPLSCSVTFRVRNDRVESWQANGNHCVN